MHVPSTVFFSWFLLCLMAPSIGHQWPDLCVPPKETTIKTRWNLACANQNTVLLHNSYSSHLPFSLPLALFLSSLSFSISLPFLPFPPPSLPLSPPLFPPLSFPPCIPLSHSFAPEMSQKDLDIITIPDGSLTLVHEPKLKLDLTKYMDLQKFWWAEGGCCTALHFSWFCHWFYPPYVHPFVPTGLTSPSMKLLVMNWCLSKFVSW